MPSQPGEDSTDEAAATAGSSPAVTPCAPPVNAVRWQVDGCTTPSALSPPPASDDRTTPSVMGSPSSRARVGGGTGLNCRRAIACYRQARLPPGPVPADPHHRGATVPPRDRVLASAPHREIAGVPDRIADELLPAICDARLCRRSGVRAARTTGGRPHHPDAAFPPVPAPGGGGGTGADCRRAIASYRRYPAAAGSGVGGTVPPRGGGTSCSCRVRRCPVRGGSSGTGAQSSYRRRRSGPRARRGCCPRCTGETARGRPVRAPAFVARCS